MHGLQKLLQVNNREEIERLRAKEFAGLTTEQANLQNTLEDCGIQLSVKTHSLQDIRNQVISLTSEVKILEKQEETVKNELRELIRSVVVKEEEIGVLQTNYWRNVISYVDDTCHDNLNTLSNMDDKVLNQNMPSENKKRLEELNQLKLEGQIEANQLYQHYQEKKITELQYINIVLSKKTLL